MELATFDAHCDVLMKLFVDPKTFLLLIVNQLHVTKQSLINEGAKSSMFCHLYS